jgi:hypothetical protein
MRCATLSPTTITPEPETINYKAVYDADLIVNLEENQSEQKLPEEKLAALIEKNSFTETGRKLARSIFLTAEPPEAAAKIKISNNKKPNEKQI